ncbi:MAG: PaaX family transcriptional regulator [Stackebrandtia sp.]
MSAAAPRSLIVTVYGLYARPAGGALPISGLVRLLSEIDVDAQAVRAAVSRLKRRGMLEPAKISGAAGYALTDAGWSVLDDGDARIFRPRRSRASDGWTLCVFSIPESERAKRHVLRGKLAWLGFGQAAPGVWIAPAHVLESARDMLRRHDLSGYVSLFRADYFGDAPAEAAAAVWWDLPKLDGMYREFLDRHGGHGGDADPLAVWINAVTEWRVLPFLDPGLPAELLPPDWPGHAAVDLFHRLDKEFAGPAAVRARELLGWLSLPVG